MFLSVHSALRALALVVAAALATGAAVVAQAPATPDAPSTKGAAPVAAAPATVPPTAAQPERNLSNAPQMPSRKRIDIAQIAILTPVTGVAMGPYVTRIRRQIYATWLTDTLKQLPSLPAKDRALSVTFWVTPTGNIEDTAVHDSSGVPALDDLLLKALHDASPLDPLPSGADSGRLQFEMTCVYVLLAASNAEVVNDICKNGGPWAPAGPPFDKVDVVALLAGDADLEASRVALCSRGISFKPDADFEQTLGHYQRDAKSVDFVTGLAPKSIVEPSAARVKAYNALESDPNLKDHVPNIPDFIALDQARALAPESGPLALAEARLDLAKKENASAEGALTEAIKLWADSAEAQVRLAMLMMATQRFAAAVAPAREAVRIAPADLTAQAALGTALLATGQFRDAIAPLRAAQPVARAAPVFYRMYAIALLRSGNYADAVSPLTNFIKANDHDAYGHYLLGVAYRELNKKDEAIAEFDKAGLLAPTVPLFAYASSQMHQTAGSDEHSGPPAATQAKLRDGATSSGGVYTNKFLGFSYAIPAGWHELDAAACRKFSDSQIETVSKNDPITRDTAGLGMSMAIPLVCAVHGEILDPKSTTSIRLNTIDSSSLPEALHAETIVKVLAAGLDAANRLAGGPGVAPKETTIDGRQFWIVESDRPRAGVSLLSLSAETDINGYVVSFDFNASDAATLGELKKTLDTIKFTPAGEVK